MKFTFHSLFYGLYKHIFVWFWLTGIREVYKRWYSVKVLRITAEHLIYNNIQSKTHYFSQRRNINILRSFIELTEMQNTFELRHKSHAQVDGPEITRVCFLWTKPHWNSLPLCLGRFDIEGNNCTKSSPQNSKYAAEWVYGTELECEKARVVLVTDDFNKDETPKHPQKTCDSIFRTEY